MASELLRIVLLRLMRVAVAAHQATRWLTGDPAYETYLRHWHSHHAGQGAQPLSRKAFFQQRTRDKWNGIKRCC